MRTPKCQPTTATDTNGKAPRKMIHSTRQHNEGNVNGWELRQGPPQQVTRPLTHPLPQVNHHCDGDTTLILACECSPGQARQVRPQQPLGPHVDTHHRTDNNGGSVSMGSMLVHVPHCSYHLRNLPNLAALHGGVN